MIDLRHLRENPEAVRDAQRARRRDPATVDAVLEADVRWRETTAAFESARAEQKSFGKKVAQAKGEEKQALLAEVKQLAADVKRLEAEAGEALTIRDAALREIPNLAEGAPEGLEDDFTVREHVGEVPRFDHPVKDHLEIAEGLRAIDMARGAKVSGARFYFLRGIGAQLELAILNSAIDQATRAGFTPMITPTLVLPEAMEGTGFLGEHADEVYHLDKDDDLYLVGTSEVALAGYHKDEIIDLSDGPLRYAGWSACYRREAGSYGKDTRGIIRVHQFHKVEMFSYCRIEDSYAEHERLLDWEREMMARIDVPYRIIDTAAGDLGTSAARKFDCEAWMPSQETYRELTSTSNTTQFQARRLNIRERTEDGLRPVATLNGTLGTTRFLAAILENHQQGDGSVVVPEGLRPYLGGREVFEPVGGAA
ncbi:Seryl-tRNA synthetase [Brachybacterium faecium]|uniref:Serine--tRNA ligase n=1 Tax=Brachybacterium faecium (strain ATCC 43885 / DSM 4810 / JCM 11609 / LMG 19847 / NBRC 14762 / NCIMB 9860 / 6-10) TaxID=446465 RepID=C7MIB9_BRAFD|nr:serine--tRNA ligase [Brachybacterium faecium]ACU84545.1 seryl-tRNA synthetase [Brachybacterium faecium DSM 4810]SLN01689.1 Seryl-tRNA synthetase [Brachybacterium faecium]